MRKYVYLGLGHLSFGLGILGTFLPILPTTPFILLAAYFYSKSSKKLYYKLLNIPRFGSSIKDWNEHGVVSFKSKLICVLTLISVGLYVGFLTNLQLAIKLSLNSLLFFVGLFILSRPSQKKSPQILTKKGILENLNKS